MEFYQRLKQARENSGLRQIDVANKLGVSKSTYSSYESGRRTPDVFKIQSLASILDVSGDWLIGTDDSTPAYELSLEEQRTINKFRDLEVWQKKIIIDLIDGFIDNAPTPDNSDADEDDESICDWPMIDKTLFYSRPSAGDGNMVFNESGYIRVRDSPLARKADYVLQVSGRSMEPKLKDGDFILVKHQADIDIGEIGIFVVDGDAFVKQRKENCLHSINPDYPDIKLNANSDVTCYGKVIGKAEM